MKENLQISFEQQAKAPIVLWLVVATAYLVIRFGLTSELDSLGTYSSYIIEVICVTLAAVIFGQRFFALLTISRPIIYGSVVAVLIGIGAFKLARVFAINIPFDLKSSALLVLLLVVAPVLEELIFRFFLWQPIQLLAKKSSVPWLLTSILFAYGHLHAVWFLPEEVHEFIFYQAAFTLFLGLACGYVVYRYSTLAGAMLIHFSFNSGFYLASLMS